MSRIGNQIIEIPAKTEIKIDKQRVTVKGPLGSLNLDVPEEISVEKDDKSIIVKRSSDFPSVRSKHGLVRSLLNNMVIGVTKGYEKRLELVWPGGKMKQVGKDIQFDINFITTTVTPPEGVKIEVGKANKIIVSGIDKQKVGQTAAKIRDVQPPEPYKQKGIRYENEYIRKKAGKAKV